MKKLATFFGAALAAGSAPAAAEQLTATSAYWPKPRPIAAFSIASQELEMLAVTRLARADTPLRQDHLQESITMSKVMPGYPQQAFVSFDIRLKF